MTPKSASPAPAAAPTLSAKDEQIARVIAELLYRAWMRTQAGQPS